MSSRRLALAAAAVTSATVVTSPQAARAQSTPQVQAQLDESTVGVGDVLHLQMSASSGDTMPADPQPGPTPGLVVRGANQAPSQTHFVINGARSDRYSLTVDWALQAQRAGTFTLGPASVAIGGQRFTAHPLTVHVVPAGQAVPRHVRPAPAPQSPFTFSPFDPWRNMFPGFDPGEQEPPTPPPVTTDPKLALETARAPFYFIHATVDKTNVVVGERITFTVYEYIDQASPAIEIDEQNVHDAPVADFVKRPLLREDQEPPVAGYAAIDGHTWVVKAARRWALFPLHAGDLTIGSMTVGLARPRSAAGSVRKTEAFTIHVAEPPMAGRPPGYAVGDVGRFALTADVKPRALEQGGAVGVHVELSGTGNLPSAIVPPAREGTEWLAPEVHEKVGAIGQDSFGGTRTFDYVVRVKRAGDVDLGEMALPYWDPDRKAYGVTRAPLGVVKVSPSTQAAAPDEAQTILPGLPGPRDALEGLAVRRHPDDSWLFWLAAIGAGPLAFGGAVGGRATGRKLRAAWGQRRSSPAAELKERLADARRACGGDDARGADAAIHRALEAAAVAHVGVRVRDAVGDELVDRLERAGVDRPAATRVADLLRECETARFAPDAGDVVAARDRWVRAQTAIRSLERG